MKQNQKKNDLHGLADLYLKHGNPQKRGLRIAFLLMLCLFFVSINTYAQSDVTVKGKVTDTNGMPLPGANVVEKGTSNGVSTDFDGNFSIMLQTDNSVLLFSYIGYLSREIVVGDQTNIVIILGEGAAKLDEVVVIGYGSVKKKDLLGAVSTIKEDALSDRKSSDVIASMQGLTSGVKITESGQPGSSASIIIRGLGSLTNNAPLFIIDGAYGGDDLGVNIEDIESIQVLKDAASAAIYGSRAANGVVIITTKQGRIGKLKVKFDSQITLNWLPRYDLMDAETYKIYDDRAYDEAILSGVPGVTKRQDHFDGNTDWQEEMLDSGILQNYNVSFSGGSEELKLYTSLNRLIDKGALYNTGYDKYGFRINSSGKKGIFSYGENIYYTKSNRKLLNGNPWVNFIGIPPTIHVYDESNPGGFGYGDVDGANSYGLNPVAMQELWQRENEEEFFTGNIYGQLSLFDDALKAKFNVAYKGYIGSINSLRKSGSWVLGQGDDNAFLEYNNTKFSDILLEQTFDYKNQFGEHNLNAVIGGSYNKFRTDGRWITKQDPLRNGDKYITTLDAATGDATAGGSYGESALISFFGRVNYAYADKYLTQLTVRRDGTSRLPEDTRWGDFYSGSLGWRISGEDFFDVSWINDLKLRGSYGMLGNSSIGFWDYQSVINTAPRAVFGSPEYEEIGMTQSRLSNSDLVWEKKSTGNIGFDLVAFDNRFSLTAEYFISKSEDLLVYLPILMTSGNEGGAPAVNAGSLENKGVELELGWKDKINDFSYTTSLNVSHLKNKVLDLGYGQTVLYTGLTKTEIGKPLGSWYLYKMNGIFQTESDVNNHVNSSGQIIQPNALPGDIIYDDYNDDGIISSEDRQIVGSPWADFELSLNIGAAYKGFDLAINSYGRFGQMVWNGTAAMAGDFANNQNNFNGLKPWTQEHPVNDRPRIVYGDTRNSRSDQDRWLEDGSFFRISQITLGYNFPSLLGNKLGLENLRATVTGQNLITFTKYSGLDPEFADNGIFEIGANYGAFPNPRSVQFALSFTF